MPTKAKHCHIVKLAVAVNEFINRALHIFDYFGRAAAAFILKATEQSLVAKKIMVFILSLGYAEITSITASVPIILENISLILPIIAEVRS